MKKLILILILAFDVCCQLNAQSFTACTSSYGWDEWQNYIMPWNHIWEYSCNNDWMYAIPSGGNTRDFYFRFNYSELDLHELHGAAWKAVKKNKKWLRNLQCTFEYYVTDDYPTLKDALKAESWPCAKREYSKYDDRPIVLRSVKAKVNVKYDDNDEVRTLNFWIDGLGFAIDVHWDYSGYKLTYRNY